MLVEGFNVLKELHRSHRFHRVLLEDGKVFPYFDADDVNTVSASVMQKISGVETPEGILAELSMPLPTVFEGGLRLLVIDQVRDPGNLGTLLRTALAFSWDGVYLLEGSVDPFNDKVLRSSKGASFKIPWATGTWNELSKVIERYSYQVLLADLQGSKPEEISPTHGGRMLILSNEAWGVSEQREPQKVTLPISGAMESLNVAVAGGILMYLLRK